MKMLTNIEKEARKLLQEGKIYFLEQGIFDYKTGKIQTVSYSYVVAKWYLQA